MPPSHYLNQCWLIISKAQWHSYEDDFTRDIQPSTSQIRKVSIYLRFYYNIPGANVLTHWGRVMHICIGNLNIIGSNNGLWPSRHQAIIWTNAGILLVGPLGTNFSEISIEILIFSFKKKHFESVVSEMVAILSQPQCVNMEINSNWRLLTDDM